MEVTHHDLGDVDQESRMVAVVFDNVVVHVDENPAEIRREERLES